MQKPPLEAMSGPLDQAGYERFQSLRAPLLLLRGHIAPFAWILQKSGKGPRCPRGLCTALFPSCQQTRTGRAPAPLDSKGAEKTHNSAQK